MKIFTNIVYHTILSINALLCCAIIYLWKTFPNAKIEEIIFAISLPLGEIANNVYTNITLFFVLPFVILFIGLEFLARKLTKRITALLTILLSIFVVYIYLNKLDFYNYLDNLNTDSDFIEIAYVDPKTTRIIFPDKKNNLIFIVLESMELSYADKLSGGGLDNSRIQHLTNLARSSETFNGKSNLLNGFFPMYGTTWTMGASFAFNTGLPLKIGVSPNSMGTQKHFFSSVKALGDILLENGYKNYVLLGSDATFAGTELFFKEHGSYEILDYKFAINNELIPKDYYVWWGFEDSKLYSIAKQKLLEIKNNQPFNFTLYTMDTHMEDGYLSDHCPKVFDDKYSNVINCSSLQTLNFINWIMQQDFYKNTTIVVVGDHLTMDSDYAYQFPENYQRKSFVSILNSPVKPEVEKYRNYSTFDIFPTIISSIGGNILGDRLGLGVNLYSKNPTIIEQIGYSQFNEEIYKNSPFMKKLSNVISPKFLSNKEFINKYTSSLNTTEKNLFNNLMTSKNITDYLHNLKILLKNKRYIAIFSARNGVMDMNLNVDIIERNQTILRDFGLKSDFISNKKSSYVALVNGDTEEYLDNINPITRDFLIDNHSIKVISSGVGNYAYINIDDMEASKNGYGLNVVVYDKILSQIVDSKILFPHNKQ